ncbi:MAG: hypothetical protein KKD59_10995 [Acidobacteria bacterium]|nr:hypothetical protein [Acidobacteriota bacterium]MBU4329630.1 hypothetical protein [Acidobacteriota bacterium]MCG2817087.1 hypothetical protein [Candidatus Aminicenantes bacterium]
MKIHNYFGIGSKNIQNKEEKNGAENAFEGHSVLNENIGTNGREPEDVQKRPDFGDTVYLPPFTEAESGPETEPEPEPEEEKIYIRSNDSTSVDYELIKGPIGLDVGTTSIVLAHKSNKDFKTRLELNAFYTIPSSPENLWDLRRFPPFIMSPSSSGIWKRWDFLLSRSMRG